jgi:hypothetical protein
MPDQVKIGDTLWCHWRRGDHRRWQNHRIISETRSSWIMDDSQWHPAKVKKDTLIETNGWGRGMGGKQWFTAATRENLEWLHTHRPAISSAVGACQNVAVLKAIKAILDANP